MRGVAYQFNRCWGGGSRCEGLDLGEEETREERREDAEMDIFEHFLRRKTGSM